jgi:hypothetical protein
MQEHRRHPRLDFGRRAWCEHPTLTLYLPVTNVSSGGMFLQTGAAFLPGETLKISIDADEDEETVVAEVEIVWTGRGARGSWGCGVRLTGFSSGEEAYRKILRKGSLR